MSQSPSPREFTHILRDMRKIIAADPSGAGFACRPVKLVLHEHSAPIGRFKGVLGLPVLAEFATAMNDLLSDRVQKVILDFSAVTITHSGVGALMAFAATIHGLNKRLYLYQASEQVQALLEQLQLQQFFVFIHEENDIVMSLVV